MRVKKRAIRLAGLAVLLLVAATAGVNGARMLPLGLTETAVFERETDYHRYRTVYSRAAEVEEPLVIPAAAFTGYGGEVEIRNDFEGMPGASVLTGETGYVEWEVEVDNPGLYNIAVTYFPVAGRRSTIQRELWINGERPFSEAGYLDFHRIWTDGGEVKRDNQGNEIRPVQVEKPMWRTVLLTDSLGTYTEPLAFHLEKGKNLLRLVSRREPMAIHSLELRPLQEIPSYATVREEYEARGYQAVSGVFLKVQGEEAVYRSSPTLFPVFDRSDPTVEPYHHTLIRLNTIGGQRWSQPGDWIAWEVEVPETGLYQISFKAKQNARRGFFSNRKLKINGKVPFKEVEAIRFPFSSRYRMVTPGREDRGEPYLFLLNKGKNLIELECVLGDLAELIRTVQESLYEINTIYRRIIMITSPQPDPLRDYQLEKRIPHVIEELRRQSRILAEVAERLEEYTGHKGSHVAILNYMSTIMERMAENPERITWRLTNFRDNAGALGEWILNTREQMLQIDYLVVAGPDQKMPRTHPHFGQVLLHELRAFFASFFHDYTAVGNIYDPKEREGKKPLKVWVFEGRDQAMILKEMIEDSFTPETGIPVNLELINNPGILLPATLAGRGPDVAVRVQPTQPIDFALRGAAVDLTQFPDFPGVLARFHHSAVIPFVFRDKVYALPDEHSFFMLFYRKDILSELGLQPPQTWDDVLIIIPELKKHHMEFGLPFTRPSQVAQASGMIGDSPPVLAAVQQGGVATLTMLLYQMNEELYKYDGVATNLDSEAAVQAFSFWTELYELYELPHDYDPPTRFRLGEMPVMVQDLYLYNFLSVFAPELRGEWDFTLVPGTPQRDGTINRAVPITNPGTMILQSTAQPEEAWEFLKWWTETETQVRYGRELESIMGPAARYRAANLEAAPLLPWTVEEYALIDAQREWAKGVPNVPGSYMVGRHIDNAFRRVSFDHWPARETLFDYNRIMNEEIELKRREFGLETTLEELDERWKKHISLPAFP